MKPKHNDSRARLIRLTTGGNKYETARKRYNPEKGREKIDRLAQSASEAAARPHKGYRT